MPQFNGDLLCTTFWQAKHFTTLTTGNRHQRLFGQTSSMKQGKFSGEMKFFVRSVELIALPIMNACQSIKEDLFIGHIMERKKSCFLYGYPDFLFLKKARISGLIYQEICQRDISQNMHECLDYTMRFKISTSWPADLTLGIAYLTVNVGEKLLILYLTFNLRLNTEINTVFTANFATQSTLLMLEIGFLSHMMYSISAWSYLKYYFLNCIIKIF